MKPEMEGLITSNPRPVRDKERKAIAILILLFAGVIINCGCIGQKQDAVSQKQVTISVSGANALQPMMEIWAREYQKLHPEVKIIVTGGGAGKGMTEALAGTVDIGMVSRNIRPEEIAKGAFWVAVAKDAVIGTINDNNPAKDTILSKGLTRAQLVDLFTKKKEDRTFRTWGLLIGNATNEDNIIVYTRQDACGAADMWSLYLGKNYRQDNLTNAADVAIIEDAPLRDALAANKFGIGYNNINTIYNLNTTLPYPGVCPIPLDLNENGALDKNETFYENSSQIINAISSGKYPSPPSRDENVVTKGNFTGATKEFVNWILTDGQQYVTKSGYVTLPEENLDQQLEYLKNGRRS